MACSLAASGDLRGPSPTPADLLEYTKYGPDGYWRNYVICSMLWLTNFMFMLMLDFVYVFIFTVFDFVIIFCVYTIIYMYLFPPIMLLFG